MKNTVELACQVGNHLSCTVVHNLGNCCPAGRCASGPCYSPVWSVAAYRNLSSGPAGSCSSKSKTCGRSCDCCAISAAGRNRDRRSSGRKCGERTLWFKKWIVSPIWFILFFKQILITKCAIGSTTWSTTRNLKSCLKPQYRLRLIRQ